MDIDLLRTFVEVVDSGSFDQTANNLFISKATIRRRLKKGLGQALSRKNTDFNFSHIQPGSVNGCMMDFQTLCDLPSYVRLKGFIQRRNGMDIQIIHDQHNFFTVVIMDFCQLTQEMGKIHGCPGVSQFHHSLAGQRFKRNEQVSHTVAAVFIILPLWTSGLRRNPPLLNELPIRLIQADHRAQRIIRTLIYIQNVLHPRYKLRPWFWDAPFLLLPRLKFVFQCFHYRCV